MCVGCEEWVWVRWTLRGLKVSGSRQDVSAFMACGLRWLRQMRTYTASHRRPAATEVWKICVNWRDSVLGSVCFSESRMVCRFKHFLVGYLQGRSLHAFCAWKPSEVSVALFPAHLRHLCSAGKEPLDTKRRVACRQDEGFRLVHSTFLKDDSALTCHSHVSASISSLLQKTSLEETPWSSNADAFGQDRLTKSISIWSHL